MTTISKFFSFNQVISIALGLLAAWVILATLRGNPLPLITNNRVAVLALFGIGFLMCSFALGSSASQPRFSWTNPFTIIATVLGILAIVLALFVFTGWPAPLINSDRAALIAMAGIIFLKWALTFIHQIMTR